MSHVIFQAKAVVRARLDELTKQFTDISFVLNETTHPHTRRRLSRELREVEKLIDQNQEMWDALKTVTYVF